MAAPSGQGNLKDLFNEGLSWGKWQPYPDSIIVSEEGHKFEVHSKVVCSHSTVFAQALKDGPDKLLVLQVSIAVLTSILRHIYGLQDEVSFSHSCSTLLADDAVNLLEAAGMACTARLLILSPFSTNIEQYKLVEFSAQVEKAVCEVLKEMSANELMSFGIYLYECRFNKLVTQSILDQLVVSTIQHMQTIMADETMWQDLSTSQKYCKAVMETLTRQADKAAES